MCACVIETPLFWKLVYIPQTGIQLTLGCHNIGQRLLWPTVSFFTDQQKEQCLLGHSVPFYRERVSFSNGFKAFMKLTGEMQGWFPHNSEDTKAQGQRVAPF